MRTSSGVTYLAGDHLGSASLAMGTSNTSQRYYPYGGTRSGGVPTDYQFTGQKNDGGTGLYYYGARYYDPVTGRFISADTLVPAPGNPQFLNRYAYTLNNPLRYTDPTGHMVGCGAGDDTCGQSAQPGEAGGKLPLTGLYANAGVLLGGSGGPGRYLPLGDFGTSAWYARNAADWNGDYGTTVDNWPYEPSPAELIALGYFSGHSEVALEEVVYSTVPWLFTFGAVPGLGIAAPVTKAGSKGGPTAGKGFSRSGKRDARLEEPTLTCVYCGRPGTGTQVDHAVPKSLGGNVTAENRQLACPHCNLSKGNRSFPLSPPAGFMAQWPPSWWGKE